ncbi:VanZ family protein [Thiococcus pfennigii]|uniref:VanZ family protein n=1 Tax=Thiococcus pfennigii TaxID=1057 RepID=UPI00190308F6|nr:hypothetical protein [Thiococcus pfennigii]
MGIQVRKEGTPLADLESVYEHILLRRFGLGVIGGALSVVLLATLFPFNFHLGSHIFDPPSVATAYDWDVLDVLNNVVLFLPLGFGLGCLSRAAPWSDAPKVWGVLFISAFVSAAVEFLQMFLPTRCPAFADLLANAFGGVVGYFLFQVSKNKVCALLSARPRGGISHFTLERLKIAIIAYFLAACLVTAQIATSGHLDRWDESFPLMIGNEHTGDRPWTGVVSELVFANKALSRQSVEGVFSGRFAWASLGDRLIAQYDLSGCGPYPDRAGNLPNLAWRSRRDIGETDGESGRRADFAGTGEEGARVDPYSWLETARAATPLANSVRATSEFTLSVAVAATEGSQTGPARIISISEGPWRRNLTLGQEESDLILRLRTRTSGENGSDPELRLPNVFVDDLTHQIIVTYDGQFLRVYVDRPDETFALEMPNLVLVNPGAALWRLASQPGTEIYSQVDLGARGWVSYKIVYFGLIFVPMGVMLGVSIALGSGRSAKGGALLVAGVLLSVIGLAWVWGSGGRDGLSMGDIFLGLSMVTTSTLLFGSWAANILSTERLDSV